MTGRDLRWRTVGALLYIGGCASVLVTDTAWVALEFVAVIIGIVLMLKGKRVAVAIRAELRGHWGTADAVHAARLRRRR